MPASQDLSDAAVGHIAQFPRYRRIARYRLEEFGCAFDVRVVWISELHPIYIEKVLVDGRRQRSGDSGSDI